MGVTNLMVLSTGEKITTIHFDKILEPKRKFWECPVARRVLQVKTNDLSLNEVKHCQHKRKQ